MAIRFFDMFAGIGGFRSGLEAIGGFECVGYCEIDKYAKQAYEAMYDTGGELYFDDARKIVPEQLPDFDLLVGGFPCQSFSIAGARKGFDDTRGTLFFRLLELLPLKNLSISSSKMFPVCLTMTQAKHLKQSSVRGPRKAVSFLGEEAQHSGRAFDRLRSKRVSRACADEGYDVCWQVQQQKCRSTAVTKSSVHYRISSRTMCRRSTIFHANKRKSSYTKKSQRKVNESTHRKDLAVLLQAVRVDLAVIRDFISLKIL